MSDIIQDMGFANGPIWPEVRMIRSSSNHNDIDCKIDIEGGTRTAIGWMWQCRGYYVAEIMVSHTSPKYQQEQSGLLTHAITETQTGTDRDVLATWVAEHLDREVNRMKAEYHVAQAIAQEEAAS
jgi:hypothetical protein